MNDCERLRSERLVFYSEDIERIQVVLEEVIELSRARSALLIDKEGHMVACAGERSSMNTDTLSALVAGSFAATREMAKLLGEDEFSVMFHQGQVDNIQLTLIDERTILTVIFDDQTQLGMVRLYTQAAVRSLAKIFTDPDRGPSEADHVELDSDFEKNSHDSLDGVFG